MLQTIKIHRKLYKSNLYQLIIYKLLYITEISDNSHNFRALFALNDKYECFMTNSLTQEHG